MNRRAAPFSIDIVVPVYNAPEDLRRCVESVLGHDHDGCRLTLIDDASPDPGVAAYFAELRLRALPEVALMRNETNLGFPGTANRGITGSRADVILLNSDTIVTGGWLRAIRHCAATDARIGTITPFSNNAEICSFPRFCVDTRWPDDEDPEFAAAALANTAVPTYPDLPTGVGFCLFIRRALLDDIGTLDPAFGAGYGEENDLCLRAARAGWRNVLAENAFVLHTGGRSFAGQKAELSLRNTTILLERFPHYERMVSEYIRVDPLAPLREAAQSALAVATDSARGVLHVIHDHGGGTETHVRALIDASRRRWRHYLAIAVNDRWQIEEHRADGRIVTYDLMRLPSERWQDFLRAICATFGIALVHLHNVSGCRHGLLAALPGLGVPYGYTVHDLNFACPTITFLGTDEMYCGAQTDPQVCSRCLAAQPAFAGVDIAVWRAQHRALLAGAAFLIAPSRWAAGMLARYFPGSEIQLIVHGGPSPASAPAADLGRGMALPDDGVPTIAVLGAIGPDKGARRLERLVALARACNAPARFVLIGYTDVQYERWQADDARFTVHGRYDVELLPELLAHYRVALVLYPSAGPETFSYTLSEAWAAGVPVLVPPIGALAERVANSGAGWVMTDTQWRDEAAMLARVVELVGSESKQALASAGRRAREVPCATLAAMADATFAVYDNALARAGDLPILEPLARARVRDALAYRPWVPPSLVPSTAETASPPESWRRRLGARVAHIALVIRHTPVGRVLRRILPRPLREALKARLRA
jgi:GT2 family glycosyltransferase/glycosyltransferase involved in cell wall biosynthesis